MKKYFLLLFLFLVLGNIPIAFAHEVYVLNQDEIHFAIEAPPPHFIQTILEHLTQFIGWGLLVIVIILAVFFISISVPVEKLLDPFLYRLKKYAPHIAQITLGIALFASGYYKAIFGVELPLESIFGSYVNIFSIILMIMGVMLAVGIFSRVAAILTAILFFGLSLRFGIYMLNYATYLGESLTIILLGASHTAFFNKRMNNFFTKIITPVIQTYKFLIIRIFFGVSLIYASLYAKFIHGALALEVVSKYDLTHYFPFDPVFLVLGSMLIEIILGIFFIIGFEIRFASLFFLVFLIMSLVFFGESVWPHLILIGTALATFTHGYDHYTFSVKLRKNDPLEPVL